MAQQRQVKKTNTDKKVNEKETEDKKLKQEKEEDKKQKKDKDLKKLLDEIDGILEENSEEFIKSYVQRGGE